MTTAYASFNFSYAEHAPLLTPTEQVGRRSGVLAEVLSGARLLVDELDVKGLSSSIDRLNQDRDSWLGLGGAGRMLAIASCEPRNVAERLVTYWRRVASQATDE